MSVCRSRSHLYVQFIDDEKHETIVAASSLDREFREKFAALTRDAAVSLGQVAAERALAKNIKQVVFDRGGFKYHGHIKALADAAREKGLEF
jgi:large subunit ribosomal protein L18